MQETRSGDEHFGGKIRRHHEADAYYRHEKAHLPSQTEVVRDTQGERHTVMTRSNTDSVTRRSLQSFYGNIAPTPASSLVA